MLGKCTISCFGGPEDIVGSCRCKAVVVEMRRVGLTELGVMRCRQRTNCRGDLQGKINDSFLNIERLD